MAASSSSNTGTNSCQEELKLQDDNISSAMGTKRSIENVSTDAASGGESASAENEDALPPPAQKKTTLNNTTSNRDERRMEINRIRAKEIRKRKKKMEEDMQKQIIQLTLENNKLRTQVKMQQAEISLLRNNMELTNRQQQQQQQFISMGQLLRAPVTNLTTMATPGMGLDSGRVGTIMGNSGLGTLNGLGTLSGTHQGTVVFPNMTTSSLTSTQNSSGISNSGGLLSMNGRHNVGSVFNPTMTRGFVNPLQVSSVGTSLGEIGDSNEDVNQQQLTKLLANSTSNAKQSLLERLRNEDQTEIALSEEA